MIKVHLDMTNIEEFRIAGTPDVLQCEIAGIIGMVYKKILSADEEEGRLFREAMAYMVDNESPVWDAPDLSGQTTVLKIPRKRQNNARGLRYGADAALPPGLMCRTPTPAQADFRRRSSGPGL